MLQKIKINYRQKYKFQMSNPVQYLVHIGHGRNWQPLFKDQEQVIVNACLYLELAMELWAIYTRMPTTILRDSLFQ